MDRFYAHLPAVADFGACTDFSGYASVPDGWTVLVADVKGSTQAIEAGRYKEVNMVGAAAITAVLNVAGDVDIPYVFGGDGATIAVPPDLEPAAREALVRLAATSMSTFGFALRVGGVTVRDLRRRGGDLTVRRLELSPGNCIALFAGGGAELADRLVKDPEPGNPYLFPIPDRTGPPDLSGLSCRWEPLAAQRGVMLSIMVRPLVPKQARTVLTQVLEGFAAILGGDAAGFAPASEGSLRFRWPPRGLWLEAKATATAGRRMRYLGILVQSFLQYLCERFALRMGAYDGAHYRGEVRRNTDFRKFDDVLRLTLDVTPDQAGRIETLLEAEFRAGRLIYGYHTAETALMTCLIFSLAQSRHVHFIDGADGGFAMAAKGYKARLNATGIDRP